MIFLIVSWSPASLMDNASIVIRSRIMMTNKSMITYTQVKQGVL